MKKIFSFIIAIVILAGCNSMQKLRVNYTPVLGNKHLYYRDNTGIGHNENVKYSILENSSIIEIPVKYTFTQDKEPNETTKDFKEVIAKLKKFRDWAYCHYCTLSNEKLDIKLYFKNSQLSNYDKDIILFNPLLGINDNPYLGINIDWEAKPEKIHLNCDSNSCIVLDESESPVNQIIINNHIKLDHKKIKETMIREKKQQKEKEEAEKLWRKKQREKCVPAINILRQSNHMYIDPILQKQATDTFVNYNCDDVAREIFEGY